MRPRGIAGPTFTNLPGRFGGRYRRAVDGHLDTIDRLGHRSTTAGARPPAGVPAPRVLVEFRATSRETTEVARPMLLPIRVRLQSAFSPAEISARSTAVDIRRVPATSLL